MQDVSGAYHGTLTMIVTDAPGEPPMRGDADARATVAQADRNVTLTVTIQFPSRPPKVVWDGVSGTLDGDGVWHGPPWQDRLDAECG